MSRTFFIFSACFLLFSESYIFSKKYKEKTDKNNACLFRFSFF